jgi:hypothetical protein
MRPYRCDSHEGGRRTSRIFDNSLYFTETDLRHLIVMIDITKIRGSAIAVREKYLVRLLGPSRYFMCKGKIRAESYGSDEGARP